jgi:hypothetical protein
MRKIIWLALPALYLLTGCHTVMVGDSITWVSKAPLESRIPNSYADGVAGRSPDTTLNSGEETTRQAVTHLLPLVDVGGWLVLQDDGEFMTYESQALWMAWVGWHLPDDRCLMWVTPWDEIKPEVTAEVARAIYDFADDVQPTCHAIADWAAVVSQEPGLLGDGIHPTPEGSERLVDLIVEAQGG